MDTRNGRRCMRMRIEHQAGISNFDRRAQACQLHSLLIFGGESYGSTCQLTTLLPELRN